MIPITPQPEPEDFDARVRKPGQQFLAKAPKPRTWIGGDFWRSAIEDLYEAYGGICAYSCEWIPRTTGDPTVDHYIPKSVKPRKAYEWANFRLACLRFNNWKREFQDVLDPFEVEHNWFQIRFPSLQVIPNPALSDVKKRKIDGTISRLRLNGGICIKSRRRWITLYGEGRVPFIYLKENAPFIAYEIERQGLVDRVPTMIGQ